MNPATVDRYTPFRELAKQHNLDALALVPGSNFRRLFNKDFHQHERPLVLLIPAEGVPAAVVPNLELGSFELINFEGQVFDWRDETGYTNAFSNLAEHMALHRVGVEGQSMRVFVHHALKAAFPDSIIIDAEKAISGLRLRKNENEISELRRAIEISEQALKATISSVRVGMTEKNIESALMQNLFRYGAEDFAFGPIVAAGDNSARPHASARADYKIKAGDTLLLDFGARYNGLCADITRTFFVAHCSDEQRQVYNTVLGANLAGHAATRAGVTAHAVDDAVIGFLEASDFADRIRTKTGHGLGRDIHEDPYIMRGNNMKLESGMVFTIEPGLYELGNFGVRIEDDVLVTETGLDCLTSYSKALTIIG